MILNKKQAARLKKLLLTDPEFTRLVNQMDKVRDKYYMGENKITEMMHCDHEWASPAGGQDALLPCCTKCGLPYMYKDLPMDEVKKRYQNDMAMSVIISPTADVLTSMWDVNKDQTKDINAQISDMEQKLALLKRRAAQSGM